MTKVISHFLIQLYLAIAVFTQVTPALLHPKWNTSGNQVWTKAVGLDSNINFRDIQAIQHFLRYGYYSNCVHKQMPKILFASHSWTTSHHGQYIFWPDMIITHYGKVATVSPSFTIKEMSQTLPKSELLKTFGQNWRMLFMLMAGKLQISSNYEGEYYSSLRNLTEIAYNSWWWVPNNDLIS